MPPGVTPQMIFTPIWRRDKRLIPSLTLSEDELLCRVKHVFLKQTREEQKELSTLAWGWLLSEAVAGLLSSPETSSVLHSECLT